MNHLLVTYATDVVIAQTGAENKSVEPPEHIPAVRYPEIRREKA